MSTLVKIVDWLIQLVKNVSVLCVVGHVEGMTQLHDVVYVVHGTGWTSAITRFNATTHQRLIDVDFKDLRNPWDIVACEQTSQLYVAGNEVYVWRVSTDGTDIKHWLPKSPDDTFKPFTLSVTSTRLLVTSQLARQLRQFDADGDELRRVQLPRHTKPRHAVESPTGTFIVGLDHDLLRQRQMCIRDSYKYVTVRVNGDVFSVAE